MKISLKTTTKAYRRSAQNAHEIRLSPAQRLIPELLQDIFLLYSDEIYAANKGPPRISRREAPLNISQTCGAWRRIVLITPRLWASLDIPIHWHSADILKEWMRRSGSQPLSLAWRHHLQAHHPRKKYDCPMAGELISHSYRWKEVRLTVPRVCFDVIMTPLQFKDTGVPMLKKLTIISSRDYYTELRLDAAPALKTLSLCIEQMPLILGDSVLKSLHELRVQPSRRSRNLINANFFDVLTSCPILKVLSVVIGTMPTHGQEVLDVTIEHLTATAGGTPSGLSLGPFLDRIRTPNLRSMSLNGDQSMLLSSSITNWPHLESFIARSRPPMLYLSLSLIPLTEAELLDCLRSLPELRILHLVSVRVTDEFLNSLSGSRSLHSPDHRDLANGGTAPLLCTSLKTISVRAGRFSEPAAASMVVHRWSLGNKQLRNVEMVSCGFRSKRRHAIEKCVNEGLRYRIDPCDPRVAADEIAVVTPSYMVRSEGSKLPQRIQMPALLRTNRNRDTSI
ncbi:hypothetical protein BD410DRAFT_784498 [Rickenella mellea]|uniref:F-box domain-containing protein n=1 Tax=Rickenella mellea TaxID=50990 RepID=A0A4Y7QDN4_9AGAM|nr:hypothetical protein BD410DRAFT_784498 [Rickenella mellea]